MRIGAERRVRSLEATFGEIVSAATATDDEHDPEGHTIAWERQQIAALLDEARAKLADATNAEERLALGTYGSCAACGKIIAEERLAALPATQSCIDCA